MSIKHDIEKLDESYKQVYLTEGTLKNFTMALSKHQRTLMETEFVIGSVQELKSIVVDIIDNYINEKTMEIADMVSAKDSVDNNETAESAKELRQAYGMMIAADNAHDVAVAREKASAVVNKIKREIISMALDEVTSKYLIV